MNSNGRNGILIIFGLLLDGVECWDDSYQDDDDQKVLTIFLPILAVAILACAGGCCYMEKKRKKRLKEGVQTGGYEDETSDNESVVTTSTIRNRPYLLPTATTGRTIRSGSRAGSIRSVGSIRSADYDIEREPPPYLGLGRRPSSVSSRVSVHDDDDDDDVNFFDASRHQRLGYDNRAMTRSSSMIDVRSGADDDVRSLRGGGGANDVMPPLRRARSVSNFGAGDNSSPTNSEWSIRTAPQMSGYYGGGRAESVSSAGRSAASLPAGSRGRAGTLKRSLSQPNLHRPGAARTGTYPQGILKRRQQQGDRTDMMSGGADDFASVLRQRYDQRQPPAVTSYQATNSSDSGMYGTETDTSGRGYPPSDRFRQNEKVDPAIGYVHPHRGAPMRRASMKNYPPAPPQQQNNNYGYDGGYYPADPRAAAPYPHYPGSNHSNNGHHSNGSRYDDPQYGAIQQQPFYQPSYAMSDSYAAPAYDPYAAYAGPGVAPGGVGKGWSAAPPPAGHNPHDPYAYGNIMY